MKRKKFIAILKSKNIEYKISKKKKITITNNNKHVLLPNVKTIPKNVKFNNLDIVDLSNLTCIPKNTSFNNYNTTNLNNVKCLHKTVVFNNTTMIHIPMLHNKTINYRKNTLLIKIIDGVAVIIDGQRNINQQIILNDKELQRTYTIYKVRYFTGGKLTKLPNGFIADYNGIYGHGDTIKYAIKDCYKTELHTKIQN